MKRSTQRQRRSFTASMRNLIHFGGHPNQFGVMTSMKKKSESDKQIDFSVGILYPERLPVLFAVWIGFLNCSLRP